MATDIIKKIESKGKSEMRMVQVSRTTRGKDLRDLRMHGRRYV